MSLSIALYPAHRTSTCYGFLCSMCVYLTAVLYTIDKFCKQPHNCKYFCQNANEFRKIISHKIESIKICRIMEKRAGYGNFYFVIFDYFALYLHSIPAHDSCFIIIYFVHKIESVKPTLSADIGYVMQKKNVLGLCNAYGFCGE